MDHQQERHLRSVPTATAEQQLELEATPVTAQLPGIVRGTLADGRVGVSLAGVPLEGGTEPSLMHHAFAVAGASVMGSAIGFAAARSGTGAIIGAGVNVGLLGLTAAAFGGDRLSAKTRAMYGGLGVFATVLAGWLSYRTQGN